MFPFSYILSFGFVVFCYVLHDIVLNIAILSVYVRARMMKLCVSYSNTHTSTWWN